ncbi:MAG: DUF169 domain-containing protein [Candidatus Geothermincolia bacterium]
MKELWNEQAGNLVDVFGLANRPVSVTFTNDEIAARKPRKTWMCRALKQAALAGESFVLDKETSACPGGSWHCGLTEPPAAAGRRALQHFLTRGEKLSSTIVSFQRMQDLGSHPPTGLSDRIYIGPMAEAPIRPDIAIFVCTAEEACRLVTLDHYWDGLPIHAELTGSLCHAAIAYPAVTGRTNLTLGDWTARRMQKYPSDIMFLTIPYERMANLVLAIPECSAGTAEVVIPEAFRPSATDD